MQDRDGVSVGGDGARVCDAETLGVGAQEHEAVSERLRVGAVGVGVVLRLRVTWRLQD